MLYFKYFQNYKRVTLAQELTPAESLNFLIFHALPERVYYSNKLNGYVVKGTSITDEKNTDNKGNENNVENKDDNSNLGSSPKENDNGQVPSDSNKNTDNQEKEENEDEKDEKKDDKPDNSFSFGSLFGNSDDGQKNEKKEDNDDGIIEMISKEIDDIENSVIRYAIKLLPGGKQALAAMDTSSNAAKTGSKIINKFN